MLEALRSLGARLTGHDSPGVVQFEADLPSREEALEQAPLYRVLRAAARGEAQSLLTPPIVPPSAGRRPAVAESLPGFRGSPRPRRR